VEKLLASVEGWRKEARARHASAEGLSAVVSCGRKRGEVVDCKAEGVNE